MRSTCVPPLPLFATDVDWTAGTLTTSINETDFKKESLAIVRVEPYGVFDSDLALYENVTSPADVTGLDSIRRKTSSSNANGLSDSDSIHMMILAYESKDQVAKDVYWIQDRIRTDDDSIGSGGGVELTVTLITLANTTPLVANKRFDYRASARGWLGRSYRAHHARHHRNCHGS